MSYDLYFVSPEEGSDLEAILERLEEEDELSSPAADARNRELAALLQQADPNLKVFTPDDGGVGEAREPQGFIELDAPEGGSGIQIMLFSDHASMSVPYWHGDETMAGRVFPDIHRYAAILVDRGGYRILDPQLGRLASNLNEIRRELLKTYASVVKQMPDIAAASEQPTKPWWKFW